MPKKIDITNISGKQFGRLIIFGYTGMKNKNGRHLVEAQCSCGIIKEYELRFIISGHTKSCGCLSRESRLTSSITHGLSKHPLYKIWKGINKRCSNIKEPAYKYYGGRGVQVSIRWKDDFQSFYDWAIKRWEPGLELDKDKLATGKTGILYCPELCCFIPSKENSRNRSSNKIIEYKGERKCLTEWCEILNLNYAAIRARINRGWSIEKTFTNPILQSPKCQ